MIKSEVEKRGVVHVLHFTKIENLSGILQHGLIPREDLNSSELEYCFNDELRIDDCESASCLSVTFPNYKMFYSYRMQDTLQEWVVISFKPDVLWIKDCAFCYSNAASCEICDISLENRKKPEAFKKMFADIDQYPDRSVLGLKDSHTTNPQAEVLVFGTIEPALIQRIFFQKNKTMNHFQNNESSLKSIPCTLDGNAFSPRGDYAHWKVPAFDFGVEELNI